ncbi:MAG: hypothetical protein M5T61_16955 [Acidimicrobiia bacterium]|nr:hypothetical protein [Acidimicrobiia bacterium]
MTITWRATADAGQELHQTLLVSRIHRLHRIIEQDRVPLRIAVDAL